MAPPGPLAIALPYLVQVQWAPSGTEPANADWSGTGVVTAPVLTLGLTLTAGAIGAGKATFSWAAAGPAQPTNGVVQVLDVAAERFVASLIGSGGAGSTTFAPVAGKTYAAYVQAAALIAPGIPEAFTLGPLSAPISIPVAAPTLTAITYDGEQLNVTWTPPAAPAAPAPVVTTTSYALMLNAGGAALASVDAQAGGGVATIDPAALGTAPTVAGAVSYGSVSGPAGTGQAPLTSAPSIIGVTLAAAQQQGETEVSVLVAAPAGLPTGAEVQVELLQDGVTLATRAASGKPLAAKLTAALAGGHRYEARARIHVPAAGGAPALTGPPSERAAVLERLPPAVAPRGVSAVYDGSALHVSWEPVAAPGIDGYLVTVAGASPTVPPTFVAGAASSETTITASFSGAFPGAASVTVQTAVQVGQSEERIYGPSSPSVVPTLSGSVRSVTVAATGQPPYAFRRGAYTTLAKAREASVVTYLDNVFASGTPTVQYPTATPVFTLAPLVQPGAEGPAYSLTLAKSVWEGFEGGTPARAEMRTNTRKFLLAVEEAHVKPGGIALVRQALAAALPQTFAETLYYRYGVWQEEKLRAVDLDAGLRLRIAGAAYQTPSASVTDPRNGFVALGTEEYDLAEIFPVGTAQAGLAPALTVDAFLALLLSGAGSASGSTVAAGSADFFGPGARQAYFRLFYPQTFPGSGSIGSTSPIANVAVVGAQSLATLESATETYVSTGNLPAGESLFVAYFRGRAMLTPLLAVTVDGQLSWVPVGTTVRQLLAARGAPAIGPHAGAQVRMTRLAAGITDWQQSPPAITAESVNLTLSDLTGLVPQLWPLDLPLLGGDEISLTTGA